MELTRGALASLAILTFFGCASQNDLNQVRRDADEMKNSLFTLEMSLAEVRGEVKDGVEQSLAGTRKSLEALQKDMTGYQMDMAAIRKGGADLQATLDSARVEMQLLTGKVDDVRILAQKPADDLNLLKEDLGRRLAALDMRLAALEKSVAEQQKSLAEQQKKESQKEQPTPEILYQQAYDALKAGDFIKARELFGTFLAQNPKHNLAANAHYWLGETYYGEKKFEQAVLEFQEVIKNFPEKEKVPAAMLKQGMAFKEMGDGKSAIYIYKKLVEEFPKTEEAKIAREKLHPK